ncbi:MAG: hypothetical protein ABI614_21305 [Planctomycetota bacterium]
MRPLIRFRLRSLFIAMSLIAMAAAFVGRPLQGYRVEQDALARIPGPRQITHTLLPKVSRSAGQPWGTTIQATPLLIFC